MHEMRAAMATAKSRARRKPTPAVPGGTAVAAFLATIGREVRRHRAKRGMTRRQLAGASETSERYLAQIERGAANPGASVLRAIAQAADVPPGAASARPGIAAGTGCAQGKPRRHPRTARAGTGRRIA